MANLGEILGGGASGAASFSGLGPEGAAIGGGLGLLGALFSHGPREDPIAKQQRLFQQGIADRLMSFSQGVPGSDPGELAALSSARGQLGAEQRQYQGGIFNQYNPQMRTSLADMAGNLASRFSAQSMALQETQLTSALQARRDALLQAAQVAPRGGAQYQPPSQLPQLMGTLAQSLAYQQAKRKAGQQGDGSTPGDVPVAPGGYNAGTMAGPAMPPGMGPARGGGPLANGGAIPTPNLNLNFPSNFANVGTGTPVGTPPGASGAMATTQAAPSGPTLGDQTYAAQQGALPNPWNNGGQAAQANQWRQAAGLYSPSAQLFQLPNPYGLKFGT